MSKTTTIIGAAGLAVFMAAGAVQTDSGQVTGEQREIWQLQKDLLGLEARIERLEARVAMETPGFLDGAMASQDKAPAPRGASSAEPPSRIMRFDAVETADPESNADEEIARLTKEIDALERTVAQGERKMTSLSAGYSGGGSSYRGRGENTVNYDERRRRAEAEIQAKYKTQLRQKEGELKRLQRELAEPRQIIHGTWEGKIITLRSTRDVSGTLDRIDVGSYIAWEGRRLSEDETSQEWVVTSVTRSDWQGPMR